LTPSASFSRLESRSSIASPPGRRGRLLPTSAEAPVESQAKRSFSVLRARPRPTRRSGAVQDSVEHAGPSIARAAAHRPEQRVRRSRPSFLPCVSSRPGRARRLLLSRPSGCLVVLHVATAGLVGNREPGGDSARRPGCESSPRRLRPCQRASSSLMVRGCPSRSRIRPLVSLSGPAETRRIGCPRASAETRHRRRRLRAQAGPQRRAALRRESLPRASPLRAVTVYRAATRAAESKPMRFATPGDPYADREGRTSATFLTSHEGDRPRARLGGSRKSGRWRRVSRLMYLGRRTRCGVTATS